MKKEKLFIVIVKYIVELEIISKNRKAHLEYLDQYYSKGIFLASGRQNPKFAGVIIAKAESLEELYQILAQDPYHQNLCAEYQAIEFEPNKGIETFEKFLNSVNLDIFPR